MRMLLKLSLLLVSTEADNLILYNAVTNLGVKRIISAKIEHHVLHTVEYLKEALNIQLDFVDVLSNGDIDVNHLETLLKKILIKRHW